MAEMVALSIQPTISWVLVLMPGCFEDLETCADTMIAADRYSYVVIKACNLHVSLNLFRSKEAAEKGVGHGPFVMKVLHMFLFVWPWCTGTRV